MRFGNVLRVPGFRLLLVGETVNATGNWVAVVAIWGFASFRFDAGAGDLALLFVALSVPGAVLGPLLGVPIDRFGPRRTLIVANALGFADALLLTQADSYRTIILLALPLGLIEALAAASLDALAPRLVDDTELVRANALLGGAQDFAVVTGPVVAAVVHSFAGLTGAFLTDAATFLVGAAVAWRLDLGGPTPAEPGANTRSTWTELRAGLALVRRSFGLRWTFSTAAATYLLWSMFGILEPLYVRDVLHASDTTFALLQAAFGVGLVASGLALATIGDRVARPRNVAIAMVISGLTAAAYVGTESIAIAFVAVFLWGLDVAFFYVPAKTLMQRYAPTEFHGRVLSFNQALEPAASVVVTPIAAVAVGVLSVQALGMLGGALAVLSGLVALSLVPRLGPPPSPQPVDPHAGSSRDAIALGGPAPG